MNRCVYVYACILILCCYKFGRVAVFRISISHECLSATGGSCGKHAVVALTRVASKSFCTLMLLMYVRCLFVVDWRKCR